jgi:hypothetical protein
MNKHPWLLATLLSLAGTTPALAQYASYEATASQYDAHSDWTYTEPPDYSFQYRPFHWQVEGGPTVTQKGAAMNLDNGWNAGAGLTWYPVRAWPLGLRADASYSKFNARQPLLDQAAAAAGTSVDNGTVTMWGGDLDAELDLPLSPHSRMYLLGGFGWYKQQQTYRQNQYNSATICDWWGCAPGYISSETTVYKQTGTSQNARNVGIGFEFALTPGASFFVDARYMRIGDSSAKYDFVPVRFGLRF